MNRNLHLRDPIVQFIVGHGVYREYYSCIGAMKGEPCNLFEVDETPLHLIHERASLSKYDEKGERGFLRSVEPSKFLLSIISKNSLFSFIRPKS